MSMTREEAITQLDLLLEYCESMMTSEYPVWRRDCEALQMLIAALRPISREQVEKVWRGKWIGMTDDDGCTWYECSRCEHDLDSLEEPNHFCPACGAPMTDEAVDMMMERLEALKDGSTTD